MIEPIDRVLLGLVAPGVWGCVSLPDDVVGHVESFGWTPVVLGDPADKAELLARFAAAARFPVWVGRNWDALADALRDLSWLDAGAIAVVIDDPAGRLDPAVAATLAEILDDATRYWESRHRALATFWRGSPRFLPQLETMSAGSRAHPLQNG